MRDLPPHLAEMTFQTFDCHPTGVEFPDQAARKLQQAYTIARNFATHPEGWLVLAGETGCGKTHLAAAVGTPTISLFTATDPHLAGVERAGPRTRDLGGVGTVPSARQALTAANELVSENVKEMSNPTRDGRAMIASGMIHPDGAPTTGAAAPAPNVTIGAVRVSNRPPSLAGGAQHSP